MNNVSEYVLVSDIMCEFIDYNEYLTDKLGMKEVPEQYNFDGVLVHWVSNEGVIHRADFFTLDEFNNIFAKARN